MLEGVGLHAGACAMRLMQFGGETGGLFKEQDSEVSLQLEQARKPP